VDIELKKYVNELQGKFNTRRLTSHN
jgi:hypothetical protein